MLKNVLRSTVVERWEGSDITSSGNVVNEDSINSLSQLKQQSGPGIVYSEKHTSLRDISTPKETPVKSYQKQEVELTVERFPCEESLMITTDEGIKVYVYEGDICFLNVDSIINSSNESMAHTQGLSKIISEAASPKMVAACQKFLKDNTYFAEGAVFSTTAGNLERYKRIVHVCSPVWDNKTDKGNFFKDLSGVIISALREANSRHMSSLAIPALVSGGRGGPKQLCFSTYPNGILEYSRTYGKKSKVQEVHLVDVNDEVVNFIRAACLLSLTTTAAKKLIQK